MCIVIDVNTIPLVLSRSPQKHSEFAPVHEWILSARGAKMVYGGRKYKAELSGLKRYLSYIAELRKSGKVTLVADSAVDGEAKRVRKLVDADDFDDSHLVGIIAASGCRLLCSTDKRADKFIKMKTLYPRGVSPPSIYRSREHAHLLCRRNIVKLLNTTKT